MKSIKLFIAVIAVVMAASLTSCTVESRERHRHYHDAPPRDHDDHGGHY